MYLRKSRAEQCQTIEETLRKHKETLLEYAVKNNINIAKEDIYEEVVSGESLYARPQMLKLLEKVSNRYYCGVICMDIDRLGRGGMSDQGIILETFKQSDTQILTPSKIYDLNDENDENNIEFKAFFARFEYKQIKKRMRAGAEKSVKEGGYPALAPYGYRNATINKRPSLEIYEPEAKIVRMIFDLYANQKLGCQAITYAVNATGAKPHRADTFGKVTILRILKNPAYIGKIHWRKNSSTEKQVIVDGIHQPIIDTDTWERAQAILKTHYHPPCNTGEIKNSLSGVVYCKNCESLMKRASPNIQRKNQIASLRCPNKNCVTGSRFEYVEKSVIKYLREKLDRLDSEFTIVNTHIVDYSEEIIAIESNIKETEKQRNKLHDLLERGIYDIDTFLERQTILNNRTEELNKQLSVIKQKQKDCKILDIETMRKNITNVLETYWTSSPAERNQLLKTVLEKVIYYKEKGWKPAEFELDLILKQVYF